MTDPRALLAAGQHDAALAPFSLPAGARVLHASGATLDRRALVVLETLLFVHGERLGRAPDVTCTTATGEVFVARTERGEVEILRRR